ncbi:MAG: serine/threonine-protein kinase PknK, partial [Deltaproteobacteria bacterium]|nr:serine/threonine-protein kinase PknK [Deltaproteobacteria bacterium]
MLEGAEHVDAGRLVGRRLGEFVVKEALSSGGFGMVFRAEQAALAREAVIKVMHTKLRASETLIQRFLREARLASRLDHPFAAHIYAFGAETDGVLWIAMELVRGTPLDKLLAAQGPIPLERFVPLLERLCQVVQTAHDQGIVHRDLKPANVMVLSRAGQLLPKLLDLGIAKPAEEDLPGPQKPAKNLSDLKDDQDDADDAFAATATPLPATEADTAGRLTEEGAIMGSPLYMAPEQWLDASSADARTDIYALGVLSYEALTGQPPFAGATRYLIAMAHAQKETPKLGRDLPAALDAVLARALAKDPAERFGSALELAAAFRQASGLAEEPVGLPHLPEELRISVAARAPQPIAQAASALEAARNPHQARDAIFQLMRVVVRTVAMVALAAHAHVGGSRGDSRATDAIRRLRRRALPDAEWLAITRELVAPFAKLRDAHPIPELVDFVAGASALTDLLALRDTSDGGASDAAVRELLATAMPLVEKMLGEVAFLSAYRLVVQGEHGAALTMGVRRTDPPVVTLRGRPLAAGDVALLDASGLPIVKLAPFVQVHEPARGLGPRLFFLEGTGRRGARLVALPESFEHEDDTLWEAIGALAEDATTSTSGQEGSPYPGLSAFTADDADRFFGRERESEELVNRLRSQPLLAVVGPSGAGKSSFVQAGVVPLLPEDWEVVVLRPGAAPLASLAARVAKLGFDPVVIRRELDEDPTRLATRLHERGKTTVLVVDQLEELFTLCDDERERARFAQALVAAARTIDDPVRVILTLRDDFLLHAEALPALRARLAPALHLLTTPGRDDLLRIVLEPLRRAGYELDDPALAGEMVDALANTRSALALLSFTASKLWELRDRRFRQLTRKAYVSLGGIGGALARHAEATLDAMSPDEQRLVREVFRHAVTAEGTRAVLSRAELDQLLGDERHGPHVIEKLVAARLLVSSEGPDGVEQIEITHEALIEAWPRLVTWRSEDAQGVRLRDQLRTIARQWDERGRPTGLLWRGDALAEYRLWRSRYPGALTDLETAFANASLADAARSLRRRRALLAGSFGVLAAGMIALVALNRRVADQRSAAERSEADAKQKAQQLHDNLRESYEAQARQYVLGGDYERALTFLDASANMGAAGPAHDLLLAFTANGLMGKQRV